MLVVEAWERLRRGRGGERRGGEGKREDVLVDARDAGVGGGVAAGGGGAGGAGPREMDEGGNGVPGHGVVKDEAMCPFQMRGSVRKRRARWATTETRWLWWKREKVRVGSRQQKYAHSLAGPIKLWNASSGE